MIRLIVLISIHLPLLCCAQSENPTVSIKEQDGTYRFYLDELYYLVDRGCEYKYFERIASFDPQEHFFDGEIKDFYNNGRIALSGQYAKGLKQGEFTAFHPNGSIKWTGRFENDVEQDTFHYYYPDGKPLFTIRYAQGIPNILSYWDKNGKQRVENGKGYIRSFSTPFFQFNRWGYTAYEKRGRVINGVPDGYWAIYFIDHEDNQTLAVEEIYKSGLLIESYNLIDDEGTDESIFTLLPAHSFINAENFVFKNCNIDEHTGFTNYISQVLNDYFQSFEDTISAQFFSYTVNVDKNGKPKDVMISSPINDGFTEHLQSAIHDIDFYYPSVDEEKVIDDRLFISGEITVNQKNKLNFHSIRIKREKESEKD